MAFTALEIIALLFVILGFVKLAVILIKKEIWFKDVVKPIYSHPKVTVPVFAVLDAIILYFLLQEMSIVWVFAALAFSAFFIGVGFAAASNDLIPTIRKIYRHKFTGLVWVYTGIWLILSIWVL